MIRYLLACMSLAVFGTVLSAQTTFSESTNNTTIAQGTVACSNALTGGGTGWNLDNDFIRTYSFPSNQTITAFRFGVEADNNGSTPLTLSVWSYTTLTTAGMTLVGTATAIQSPGDGSWNNTIQTIQLDTPISVVTGTTYAVGVEAADVQQGGAGNGGSFYLGSNGLGQTSASYLRSVACGANDPSDLAGLGFANVHYILDVIGYAAGSAPDPSISVQYPSGTENRVASAGSVGVGSYAPGVAGSVGIDVQNHGASASLTHTAAISNTSNCSATSVTLGASTAGGASSTATCNFTPAAGIGTFSFDLTVSSNDTNQASYVVTVNGKRGMSGTYTVIAAGGGDYTDIGAAFDDLESYGVSGATVIEIATGTFSPGTSYELGQDTANPDPIEGLSATNTLSIEAATGATPVIDGTTLGGWIIDPFLGSDSGLMSITGDYITVDGLTFTNGANFGLYVYSSNATQNTAHNVTVRNCKFDTIANGPAVIFFGDGKMINNAVIENCMAYGCTVGGSTLGSVANGVFTFHYSGTGCVARHNTVVNDSATQSAAYGFGVQTNNANGGCIGWSTFTTITSSPLFQPPAVNYNIFHSSTSVFPCVCFQSGFEPTSADRNNYHISNGAIFGYEMATAAVTHTSMLNYKVAYTSIETNSVSQDPLLVSATDLHLGTTSPAYDLAVGSTLTTDIDGDARPNGSAADAGADEGTGTGGGGGGTITITTTTLANGIEAIAYSETLTATTTGTTGPTYTWSVTGTLPPPLALGGATGLSETLTGTPNAAGTYNFSITCTDGTASDTKAFSITIGAAGSIIITTTSLANGTVNSAYSANIVSIGGTGTLTWSVSAGTLPTGMALGGSSTNTEVLSGIPTVASTYNFTLQVTDGTNTDTQAFTVVIGTSGGPTIGGGGGGGGGCAASSTSMTWLVLLSLLAVAFVGLRRTREE